MTLKKPSAAEYKSEIYDKTNFNIKQKYFERLVIMFLPDFLLSFLALIYITDTQSELGCITL